jgi:hypothetical protein
MKFIEQKIKLKILFINLFYMISILIKMPFGLKILLCTIAKEENKYIKEFIEHYKKLKIKKIVIYDNNDINGEDFKDILKSEIDKNFVKIINYRGVKRPQIKALNNCYKRFNSEYDWIAFYDVDEFLKITNFSDINEFMSLPRFKNCQSILINWKYYGDNNKLYYENKPLYERFTAPFFFNKSKNYNIYYVSAAKTIVRGGLKIIWAHLPHYLNNTINCRPDGSIIKNYFSFPQYSIAYLNHYITKSTEEFVDRLNRGDVFEKINERYIKNRIFKYYFLFNKKTKKKLDLFRKKLKYKIIF